MPIITSKDCNSMTATYFHSGKADAAPYADELESYMSRRSHEANKAKLDDVLRPKYIDEKGSFNTSWIQLATGTTCYDLRFRLEMLQMIHPLVDCSSGFV